MDVSASSLLKGANLFCSLPRQRSNFASSAPSKRNTSRKSPGSSILFLKLPSWGCSSIARGRGGGILQISARLRRPLRRRNTLREKIFPSTVEQVRRVPETLDTDPDLELSEDTNAEVKEFRTYADADSKDEVVEDVLSESGDFSEKKSGLWEKLDNWVDQYKVDSEFWGVGTGPIFMIYQNSDNKIVRVSVSEDEIIKRSRTQAWSPEEEAKETRNLNSKIFRAKLIARMIESGEYPLPRNSSIVKVVVEGNKSFFEGLRSISLQGQPFLKMFPRLGFTFICGCCILWAARKLFVQNEKVELSSQEAEMLRRKVTLRMEREEMEKGSVKVLDDVPELPVSTRPQLDRYELMKNLKQAKESAENSFTSDSLSHLNVKTHEFDNKVREIREMARKIREQQKKGESETEAESSKKTEIDSMLWANNKPTVANKNGSALGTEAKGEALNVDITSSITSLRHQEMDMKLHEDRKNKEMFGNNSTEHLDSTADKESLNSEQNNESIMAEEDQHEKESTRCSGGEQSIYVETQEIVNCDAVSSENIINGGKLENDELHNSIIEKRIDSSSSSEISSKSAFRIKPKIITSVEEAKKFLAQRHGRLSDTAQPDQDQEKDRSTGGNVLNHFNDDKDSICQKNKESKGMDVVEASNKLQNSTSKKPCSNNLVTAAMLKRTSIDDISITTKNGDDANNNMIPMNIENSGMQGNNNVDILSDNPQQISLAQDSGNGALDLSDSDTVSQLNTNEIFHGAVDKIDHQTDSSTLEMGDLIEKQRDAQDQREGCTLNTFDNKLEIETSVTSSSPGVQSLIVNPSKDDIVSQSQELDILKDENKLWEEPQGIQDETDQWDIPYGKDRCMDTCSDEITEGKDNYVYTGSDVIEESMVVGTSGIDHKKDHTLLSSNPNWCSMSEKQDNNDTVAKLSGELEASKSNTTASDVLTTKHNTTSLLGSPTDSPSDSGKAIHLPEGKQLIAKKSWVEDNFQEFDSVIAKIGVGFKENYMSAKEKIQQQPNLCTDITELSSVVGDDELEWMNDEGLQRIVFQVRDNELAGRDPFHSMSADDKLAFFKGLEDKADKVNGKLLRLHEYIHSRIENLDYGADGISLYDSPEKIIPRWKGPLIDNDPEFLRHQKPVFTEEEVAENNLKETEDLPNSRGVSPYAPVNGIRKMSLDSSSMLPKTVIESTDGTIRAGKKKGKEHWQHTKKWSQGFLEIYNAETDPEIKSIMRDMGKDLDRWITEKETQEVADLMTKISKRKRKYIEKKLEKLKREVQMFGAPAVVSKYKEYTEEKDEDYLWWLDLPFVLCLELYTIEEGSPKVGFYSLEMAADLELDPKQHHVIAFEDPGDSKNFCYIVQAHMDMLGSGKAFVVARPPKDAFREAKANGFNVTVIRKGQIKLNVDQTLEEVEEEITEIGSKIYHDKIIHERSIDANTLMKGVIAADKTTKRRPKRTRRKPRKSSKS